MKINENLRQYKPNEFHRTTAALRAFDSCNSLQPIKTRQENTSFCGIYYCNGVHTLKTRHRINVFNWY